MAANTFRMNVYDSDLDLSDVQVARIYLKAISPDPLVTQYTLSPKPYKFKTFLYLVQEKVNDFALNRNNNFSVDLNKGSANTSIYASLVAYHDEVDLEYVRNTAINIWYDGEDKIRYDQNTLRRHMAFLIIRNLLTPQARKHLQKREELFKFGQFGDGMCYFKLIIDSVNSNKKIMYENDQNSLPQDRFHKDIPPKNADRMQLCEKKS